MFLVVLFLLLSILAERVIQLQFLTRRIIFSLKSEMYDSLLGEIVSIVRLEIEESHREI